MRTTSQRSIALVLALAAASSGCLVFKSDYERLEARVTAAEQADQQRRRQLSDAIDNATRQVQTLNEQLENARTQTRNLANIGSRIDGLEEQLRTISGGVAECRHALEQGTVSNTELHSQLTALEHRITELERRTGLAPAVDPNQIPQVPAEIMNQARQALTARDFNRARALANALIQRAPLDPLADDARLLVGRSYMQDNRAATAVQEFQRLLTDYPAGDTIPDALTEMVEALIRLGLCAPAQRTLRILIDRHGSTPQGQAARRRLEEVRHLPRAACTG